MNQPIRVEKTMTINRSPSELYHFWHNFENLPHFMKHLKSVKVYDNKRSHWVTNAPLDKNVEWDAEIIEDRENELISWASSGSADIRNSGSIRFQPVLPNRDHADGSSTPSDRGTEVKVTVEYNLPGGAVGEAIAKLFGESPKQQLGDDLRRFKMLMETGEIARTDGQPRGHS